MAKSHLPWSLVVPAIALGVGAAAGIALGPHLNFNAAAPTRASDSTPLPADKDRPVSALARLEPEGGVVPVYGPPGDRIKKLHVRTGQMLKAQEPIAELASYADREKEVSVARIQLEEARQLTDASQKAAEAKIASAQLEVAQLTTDEKRDLAAFDEQIPALVKVHQVALRQQDRLKDLSAKQVRVSQEDMEQVELAVIKADAEVKAAKTKREKAQDSYKNGRELALKKIAAATAEMNEALAKSPLRSSAEKLALAEQVREMSILKAPIAGTVLKVGVHDGEPTSAQQPILYLADTSKMVAVAEVYEKDIKQLWAGLAKNQVFSATISSDVLPSDIKLTGTVSSKDQVALMISRNAVFAMSPREDNDRRVVEVVVKLDRATAAAAAKYIGLQVNVQLTALSAPATAPIPDPPK